jgi:hypothetical protein
VDERAWVVLVGFEADIEKADFDPDSDPDLCLLLGRKHRSERTSRRRVYRCLSSGEIRDLTGRV